MLKQQDYLIRRVPVPAPTRIILVGWDQRHTEQLRREFDLRPQDVFSLYSDINRFWGIVYLYAIIPDDFVHHSRGRHWVEVLQLHGINHPESQIITESMYRRKLENDKRMVRRKSWQSTLRERGVRQGRRVLKGFGRG